MYIRNKLWNNGSCKTFLHNYIYHFFGEKQYLAHEICQLCHYSTCVMIFFFVSRVNYVSLFQIHKITYCTILVLTNLPVNLCKSAFFGSDIFFLTWSILCPRNVYELIFFSHLFLSCSIYFFIDSGVGGFFCRVNTHGAP